MLWWNISRRKGNLLLSHLHFLHRRDVFHFLFFKGVTPGAQFETGKNCNNVSIFNSFALINQFKETVLSECHSIGIEALSEAAGASKCREHRAEEPRHHGVHAHKPGRAQSLWPSRCVHHTNHTHIYVLVLLTYHLYPPPHFRHVLINCTTIHYTCCRVLCWTSQRSSRPYRHWRHLS